MPLKWRHSSEDMYSQGVKTEKPNKEKTAQKMKKNNKQKYSEEDDDYF